LSTLICEKKTLEDEGWKFEGLMLALNLKPQAFIDPNAFG
jgi:hypothetical protein